MRKLATIRQVAEIKPHTNADSLELAIVDGWQCIVRKGEFKVGDLVVYFEVDSVLPVQDQFEFLRKGCYVKKDWLPEGEGFRLKTIKLRGERSQGLVVPVESSGRGANWIKNRKGLFDSVRLGDDVTENLGVVKWDPPLAAQLQGQAKGNFPSFIPKTDQERAQNLVTTIADAFIAGDEFEVTVKLDGSSCTMYFNNGDTGVCSRNLELKVSDENKDNSFIRAFMEVKDQLIAYGRNIALQGELMGPGIQGNREGLTEHKFFLYDVWDIDNQKYLTDYDKAEVLVKINVEHVPVISNRMTLISPNVAELLDFAEGPSLNNPVREGLVYKRIDGGFSFKTISNTFLDEED